MSYIYEPEVVEEDDGYSIPKILVAVLLLVVMGAGYYIYNQRKKLAASTAYLLEQKKEVRQELDAMVRKYTLAIDDNEFLADELIEERKNIIEMRNSVDNMTEDDFNGVTNFRQRIQDMAETTSFVTGPTEVPENTVVNTSNPENESETTQPPSNSANNTAEASNTTKPVTNPKTTPKETTSPARVVDPKEAVTEELATETATPKENIAENTGTDTATTSVAENEDSTKSETVPVEKKPIAATTLGRVEIPPTYPGCSGDAASKKKCFNSKVRKFVSNKFDPSISDGMDLAPGKKRVFVMFNVDKQGRVVNIRAKAEHKKLEEEAVRVVKQLPKMLAARQNGNAVGIRNYTVPITFVVEDN